MAFKTEGDIEFVIDDAVLSDPKFGDPDTAFDVNIHCVSVDDPSQSDWWRGEISQNMGRGNMADMTQAEITFKTLRHLGFEGEDFSELKTQLEGVKDILHVKASESKDGKVFHNIQYIGVGSRPVAIDPKIAASRYAAIMGNAAPAAAAPKAKSKAAASNPFAKSAPKAGVENDQLPI